MIQLVLLMSTELVLSNVYRDTQLASYVTNIINHSLLSLFSLFVYVSSTDDDIYAAKSNTILELFCAQWLMMYFLFDLFRMFTGIIKMQSIYVAHHLIGMSLLILIEHSGMLHRYIPVICLFEMSSVPLNIRYALLHTGKHKLSSQVIYSEIIFVISFIVVRWLFGFNKAYQVILKLHAIENKNRMEVVVAYTITLVIMMFLLMHINWTFEIMYKLVKKWKIRYNSTNYTIG